MGARRMVYPGTVGLAAVLALALLADCGGAGGRGGVTCTPAPSIQGAPPGFATADAVYAADFTGAYNCGLWLCFSIEAVAMPPGAVIDGAARGVSWTPPASLAGTTQGFEVRTTPDACGNSANFQWSVEVLAAPAITSFTAAPALVRPGGTCQLTAVFTGGYGRIDIPGGASLGEATSGAPLTTPALQADTGFLLTVTNPAGATATESLTVRVPGQPAIQSFAAAPEVITQGRSASLTWSTVNGDSLRLDPGGIDVTGGTGLTVSPAADTLYTLTAANALGDSVQATAAVQVVAPPVVDAFTAATTTPALGAQVLLTATFHGGTGTVTGLGQVQSGVGALTPALSATGIWTLTVTNPAGDQVSRDLPLTLTGPGTFQPVAGTLLIPRSDHSATLLPDGRVLVAGGQTANGRTGSTEIFDPATGTWAYGPGLSMPRSYHQAVALPGGKVLIAGGLGDPGFLVSAEILDPGGATLAAGDLPATTEQLSFAGTTAAPLPGGDAFFILNGRAARYLGASMTFLDLGSQPDLLAVVAPLPDGRVLIVDQPSRVFDPAGNLLSAAGSPVTSYFAQPATATLPDGRVLATWSGQANLWDPAGPSFSDLGATGLGGYPPCLAVCLHDGRVLVVGNDGSRFYDPGSGAFRLAGALTYLRHGFTATVLADGRVLVAGGIQSGSGWIPWAELMQP